MSPSGVRFRFVREITVAGFVAEANPNVTPPADVALFDMTGVCDGDAVQAFAIPIIGAGLYLRFVDGAGVEVPTGTADFAIWCRDEGASTGGLSRWAKLTSAAGVESSRVVSSSAMGKVHIQVTALSAAGATKAQVWGVERTAREVS